MRIDSSGNVGIGTSSPASKLHVKDAVNTNAASGTGVLRLQGGASTYSGYIGFDASTMSIGTNNEIRGLSFAGGGSERMRIDSSGNVGIGTSSPAEALDVSGNIAVSGTVDGRDVSADGTKLDSVASNGWTSINDGPGTGMNSDLLDGLEANDILALRQNTQNSNYTLLIGDIGKSLYHSNGTAYSWTVPPNSSVAFPVGTAITMINDASGAVNITITRGSGVALILGGDGTDQNCTLARYGVATIIKVGTDKWYCSGNGVS